MPRAWSRMTAPWSISITRRRMLSTIVESCVAMTTVVPVRLIRSSRDMIPWLVVGSRLPVGSSARMIERPVDESPGDRHALLLAPESWSGQAVTLLAETDELQYLGHLDRDHVPGPADDLEGEGDVLEHGLVRQQTEVLEHAAEVAAQVRHPPVRKLPDLLAGHPDLAAIGDLLA